MIVIIVMNFIVANVDIKVCAFWLLSIALGDFPFIKYFRNKNNFYSAAIKNAPFVDELKMPQEIAHADRHDV